MELVFLGGINWDDLWQRPQQLASRLAERGHRVFYADPSLSWPRAKTVIRPGDRAVEVFLGLDFARRLPPLLAGGPSRSVVVLHLASHTSDQIYHHVRQPRWDWDLPTLTLQAALLGMEVSRPIFICHLPEWFPVVRPLARALLVTDMMDDFPAMTELPDTARLESDLLSHSDLAFAASRPLSDKAARLVPDARLLPNGADVPHFARAAHRRRPAPADAADLAPPVIGYLGTINARWFDVELLAAVAARRPGWRFVLIGPTYGDLRALEALPNVRLLGKRPYAVLPDYLAHFDVGLIPFRLIPLTGMVNPVKLFEYFAAGKAVVSTPLPEVAAFGELVYLGEGPEQFIAQIEVALAEGPHLARRRMAAAEANSWEVRCDQMESALAAALERTSADLPAHSSHPGAQARPV